MDAATRRPAAGARVKAHKVGLSSAVMRRQMGVDQREVVLPGPVTPSIPVGPGETVTATFGGLGSVTAVLASTGEEGPR